MQRNLRKYYHHRQYKVADSIPALERFSYPANIVSSRNRMRFWKAAQVWLCLWCFVQPNNSVAAAKECNKFFIWKGCVVNVSKFMNFCEYLFYENAYLTYFFYKIFIHTFCFCNSNYIILFLSDV